MKIYMAIVALAVVTLAFGIASADEFPIAVVETGTALYNDLVMKDELAAGIEVKGSAAGGVARVDERTKIWDDLLKPDDSRE